MIRRLSWVLAAAFLLPTGLIGQEQRDWGRSLTPATIPPLAHDLRLEVERADWLATHRSAEEAFDAYRQLLSQHGEQLVEWPDVDTPRNSAFQRFRSLRDYAWWRLAELGRSSPEALAGYRRRIDPLAKTWWDQRHRQPGSPSPSVARIVTELWLSSWGDDALLWLGDTALAEGDFVAARRHWEQLAPGLRFPSLSDPQWITAANRPLWLPFLGADVPRHWQTVADWTVNQPRRAEPFYPDTDTAIEHIRARFALASNLEGNLVRARVETAILRHVAPQSAASWGGRTGNLVDLVEPTGRNPSAPNAPGSPAESSLLRSAPSGPPGAAPKVAVLESLPAKPRWSVSWPRWSTDRELLSDQRVRVAEDAPGLLSCVPVIWQEQVLVQTGPNRNDLRAFSLNSGRQDWPPHAPEVAAPTWPERRGAWGVPRFTPTISGSKLFFLEGLSWQEPSATRTTPVPRIAAVDLAAEGKLLWTFAADPESDRNALVIAGSPAIDKHRVFVPLLRREAAADEIHVAALDARDGSLLWRRFLGIAEPAVEPTRPWLSHLHLTVAQDTLYFNTNCGLVAALATHSGSVRWMTTYPRSGYSPASNHRNDLHLYRDSTPCLIHQGTVIVAPQDCDRLFALDAVNGVVLWATPAELAADAIHLLGVSDDLLAVSGECIYWFEVHTGRFRGQFPEPFRPGAGFARPDPRGFGRGLLADGHWIWPTRDALYVFAPPSSHVPTAWKPQPTQILSLTERDASGGHLLIHNERLLIATPDRLYAF